MFRSFAAVVFATAVYGQQVGTLTAEKHPSMAIQSCTASGCTKEDTTVVLDANWRWTHVTSGYTNCYDGNTWNATACPDGKTCAENCAIDGADYEKTYGISTPNDGALKLQFVTKNENGANVGSRVYLSAGGDGSKYRMFNLLNKEFTFDVDVSNLPCGLNGAVYFSEMLEDGGLSAYPGNKAGAQYGTGYCDSQCPRDIKFINGWTGSASDGNSGAGSYGSCCAEMDIWEANLDATAYTPHPCKVSTQTRCENEQDCGAGDANRHSGLCDPDGCDFNSFRMGNKEFYGTGKTVDSSKAFTIVTQFVTDDGTDTGTLSRINRFYVQDGKVIPNSDAAVTGVDPVNYISEDFCKQQKTAFGDDNYFATVGGLAGMGKSLQNMVLVLSVWDDHAVSMNWLDSNFPTTSPATDPGVARGRCDPAAGDPKTVESAHPDASVVYSNIKLSVFSNEKL
ncbi:1,4-beta-D-glucan-cellobiohydrolyase [Sporothrix brasiliensis 5110]|uniref:Glucanase n=1 Tax=Sporothrix brasiliensis 5110 TaxID=1398154 RepID=A0A0C2EM66_9PEZI|nr:1,4-beta-D-glucan-cellobiohydrolyase [Sporothrix brasiliensis 5110]KIH87174.1 1,4-beta-D-glucan-cellobiohydrolyase [Sporothrix brasiliensis 5110]